MLNKNQCNCAVNKIRRNQTQSIAVKKKKFKLTKDKI